MARESLCSVKILIWLYLFRLFSKANAVLFHGGLLGWCTGHCDLAVLRWHLPS